VVRLELEKGCVNRKEESRKSIEPENASQRKKERGHLLKPASQHPRRGEGAWARARFVFRRVGPKPRRPAPAPASVIHRPRAALPFLLSFCAAIAWRLFLVDCFPQQLPGFPTGPLDRLDRSNRPRPLLPTDLVRCCQPANNLNRQRARSIHPLTHNKPNPNTAATPPFKPWPTPSSSTSCPWPSATPSAPSVVPPPLPVSACCRLWMDGWMDGWMGGWQCVGVDEDDVCP
jgi:hypothetical protein